jgi:hypothetical protein
MQASFTGGAPGTPTYSWSFVGASSPVVPTAFLNPLNASSQQVQFTGPLVNLQPYVQPVRVTITDPLGNVSTQDATATMQRDGGGGG